MKYFIVTGATGDLATTKLYPALAELFEYNVYLSDTKFIGAGRKKYSKDEYQELVKNNLSKSTYNLDFVQYLEYIQIDFD